MTETSIFRKMLQRTYVIKTFNRKKRKHADYISPYTQYMAIVSTPLHSFNYRFIKTMCLRWSPSACFAMPHVSPGIGAQRDPPSLVVIRSLSNQQKPTWRPPRAQGLNGILAKCAPLLFFLFLSCQIECIHVIHQFPSLPMFPTMILYDISPICYVGPH